MIKNIIFDVNDVLVSRDIKHTNKVLAEDHKILAFMPGHRDNFDNFKAHKLSFKEFLRQESKQYHKSEAEFFEIVVQAIVNDAQIRKNFYIFLESLKPKYKLAILSHSTPLRNEADRRCGILDITPNHFFSCDTGHKKTEIIAFNHVLKVMKWKPEECVFIDDKKEHTKVAESVGMKTIVFTSEDKTIKELKKMLSN